MAVVAHRDAAAVDVGARGRPVRGTKPDCHDVAVSSSHLSGSLRFGGVVDPLPRDGRPSALVGFIKVPGSRNSRP